MTREIIKCPISGIDMISGKQQARDTYRYILREDQEIVYFGITDNPVLREAEMNDCVKKFSSFTFPGLKNHASCTILNNAFFNNNLVIITLYRIDMNLSNYDINNFLLRYLD